MAEMISKNCKCCKKQISVRLADHNRGWGNFCCKSCKEKIQEKKNGQYKAYLNGRGVSNLHPERLKDYDKPNYYLDNSDPYNVEWKEIRDDTHPFSSEALGQW
jgi:hypothetical protein